MEATNNMMFDLLPYQVYKKHGISGVVLVCAFADMNDAGKWIESQSTGHDYHLAKCHFVNGRLVDDLEEK